jgi:hypothetical protein
MVNVESTWPLVSLWWNRAIRHIWPNLQMAYDDVSVIINCIVVNENILDVLTIPYTVWVDAIVPNLYSIVTQPLFNKKEVFPVGVYGYYYPFDNTLTTIDTYGSGRYEFDTTFGFGQGPAVPPSSRSPLEFPVRDFYIQLAGIVRRVGTFIFQVVADLGRPGQKFFPKFILSVDAENSYWREVSDATCSSFELLLFTFAWPNDGTGVQPQRDSVVQYACPTFRFIGSILRFVSLIVNDFLTINRPYPLAVGCEPRSSAALYLLQLFQGVPIIDFFIAVTVSMPQSTNNLNVFSSNLIWCQFGADIISQTNNPANPNEVGYTPGQAALDLPLCTGVTRGSFIPGCAVWNGITIPTRLERIDYFAQFLAPIHSLVLQFATPPSGNPDSTATDIDLTFQLIDDTFNVLILDLVYITDAFNCPGIVPQAAPRVWGGTYLTNWFRELIEFIFRPYTCVQAVPSAPDNLFLCFLATASEAGRGFFGVLCDAIVAIDPALSTMKCIPNRKRGISASEHFSKKSHRDYLTMFERYKLYSAYLAFYGRETWQLAEQCRETTQCASECALASCMPDLMDCVHARLSEKNPWRSMLDKTSNNGFYVRNSLTALAVTSDIIVGCRDNALNVVFSIYARLVGLMRDFAVRYLIVSHHHVPTYSRCMKEAHEGARIGVKFDEITRNYLRCIGLTPAANAPEGKEWSETLQNHGIRKNATDSDCASLLHSNGFLFDAIDTHTVNVEHTLYKICMFNLAFGASAVMDNSTSVTLEEFVDLRLAPFAMMRSTDKVNANNYPALANQLLLDGPEVFQRALPFEFNTNAANVSFTERTSTGVELLHPYLSIFYAYLQYMADLYEYAIIVESDGQEKDRIDTELFKKVIVAVSGAPTFGADAARKYTEEKKRAHQYTGDDNGVATALQKRTATNGTLLATSKKPLNDFTMFSKSFYWVDGLTTVAKPRSEKISLRLQSASVNALALGNSAPLIESFIDVRARANLGLPNIRFGMRQIDNAASSLTFSYLNSENDSLSVTEQEYFKTGDLRNVVAALIYYSTLKTAPADERYRASQAVAEYNVANKLLTAKTIYDSIGNNLPKSKVVNGLRAVVSVAWGLLDNRFQFNAMPPYQAAHVIMDAMTSGDSNSLVGYLDGTHGYVPRVGYVSMESYNKYMRMAEDKRKLFLGGYLQSASEKDDYRIYMLSARRNAQRRVESLSQPGQFELEGSSQYQRWLEQRLASLNSLDHTHRARFLLNNKVLHHDDMMHHAAGPNWVHYERALEIADKPLERIELALVTAAPGTALFYQQIGDAIFAFFGFGPDFVTNIVTNITGFINDIGNFIYGGTFTTLQNFASKFLESYLCQGVQDYELNGTGIYRLGCIPFFPEKLFTWIKLFPNINPGPNPLYTFDGPGPIQWPASMYAPGGTCQNPRRPEQCPLTPTSIWTPEYSTYFQRLCITNACTDPMVDTSTGYPFCSVLCDHCTQSYLSASDFGFTDGWKTLVGYDVIITSIYDNTFATFDGYYFVVIGFLYLQAIDFFSMISPSVTIIALLFAAWGELFVTKRIDRILSVLMFFGLATISTGLGWFLFLFYVVALFGPVFALSTTIPSSLVNIITFIRNTFLPGPLIIFVLNIVNFFFNILSFIFVGLRPIVTNIDSIIADFEAAKTTVLDFPNAFYTIFSSYNLVSLAVYLTPYILLVVFAGVIGVITFLALFSICGICCDCCGVCWNCCQSLRIHSLGEELDEKTENLNQRLAVLEEDKDALMAAPIATSIGINIDTTDEKHTASRRRRTESAKTK